jgi:uncharacterized protein (TIGR03663 family)
MKNVKVTKIPEAVIWFVILVLAIGSRFLLITNKPLHFDEGINGWFSMEMDRIGFYRYDFSNYHGPLYFYLLNWTEHIFGRSVLTLRSIPAVFGILSVTVFALRTAGEKKFRVLCALFLMCSPAFLFFGRSGIHEMPFVFFQILFALGMMRALTIFDSATWSFLLLGLFGMATLKETFAIVLVSWAVALVSLGKENLFGFFKNIEIKKTWTRKNSYLAGILLLLFLGLFSGFLKNPQGVADFFKAFMPWFKTGTQGNGHDKNFGYWFEVIWQAEPMVVVGMLGAIVGVFQKNKTLRAISVFSLTQFLIYSWIPYKTVWCVLSLVWGFYFVLAWELSMLWGRKLFWLYLAIVVACLPRQGTSTWRSVYQVPLDFQHPYIYVNTTYDFKDLQEFIDDQYRKDPELQNSVIQIGTKEQWPWPWFLRSYAHVIYDSCAQRYSDDNSWLYLCDPEEEAAVERTFNTRFVKMRLPIRQSHGDSVLYIQQKYFDPAKFHLNSEVVGVEK